MTHLVVLLLALVLGPALYVLLDRLVPSGRILSYVTLALVALGVALQVSGGMSGTVLALFWLAWVTIVSAGAMTFACHAGRPAVARRWRFAGALGTTLPGIGLAATQMATG